MIRYDGRDSGRSTTYEPGAPPLRPAGPGGRCCGPHRRAGTRSRALRRALPGRGHRQLLAIDHGESLASLTSSRPRRATRAARAPTCRGWKTGWPRSSSTRRPSPIGQTRVSDRPSRRDRAPIRGLRGIRRAGARQYAGRVFDRSADLRATMTNPFLIDAARRGATAWAIRVPTFVIHGADDPCSLEHGGALAREIPGAELIVLEGTGHEYRRRRHGRPSPRRSSPTRIAADWSRFAPRLARRSPLGGPARHGPDWPTPRGGDGDRQRPLGRGPDVLVQAEAVLGVVGPLDPREPGVVGAVA